MKQIIIQQPFQIISFQSALDYHWDEQFCFEGESHNSWEIVMVVSGAVEITEDSRVYRLNAGNMILHAPMEFHTIRSVKGTKPHVLVASFSAIGELPQKLTKGVFFLSEDEQTTYRKIFSLMYQMFHQESQDDLQLIGTESSCHLTAFLLQLVLDHTANRPLILSQSAKEYHRLITEMTAHVCENYTLEHLSKSANLSVSYIKVLFRRYAGVSPKIYYDNLRMAQAIQLLKSGYSAAQAAEKMHFSSPNYFSAFFKKKAGLPPVKFLKNETK